MIHSKIIFSLIGSFLCLALSLHPLEITSTEPLSKRLATYCHNNPPLPANYRTPFVSWNEIEHTLATFKKVMLPPYTYPASWLDARDTFKGITFHPFVQRSIVKPLTQIAFWGDLHGSIHSFHATLARLIKDKKLDEHYNIIAPHFYLAFLGDYVDRGMYGIEILYLLMKLKILNPTRVFIVRGNHEDRIVNNSGFKTELFKKYGTVSSKDRDHIFDLYDLLPMALYLGTQGKTAVSYIQCCHGGMEMGFNPKQLLTAPAPIRFAKIKSLNRADALSELTHSLQNEIISLVPAFELKNVIPLNPTNPVHIGFMWSDFLMDNYTIASYTQGRGMVYGKKVTKDLLTQASTPRARLRGVFRAHQHHGEMLKALRHDKGIVRLWDGMVYTFFSAPAIHHVRFHFNSFGILTTNSDFENWRLEHIWTPIDQAA